MTSFSEPSVGDVTRETTMATSEISVEESKEGEEPVAAEQDGKLSLRMKLVTPVEEGSSGSERFSLQSKSCFVVVFQHIYVFTQLSTPIKQNSHYVIIMTSF